MNKGKLFTHLGEGDRIKIEVLLNQVFSLASISRTLKRSVSTISREVKRNGPQIYRAARAHYVTGLRHRQKRKHSVFDEAMKRFIERQLRSKRWSPELISVMGRKRRVGFFYCRMNFHSIFES